MMNYYTLKDHLGNICAVVNSTRDSVIQRTLYYASGVPMAQSWGREMQPYLYNGKEFIEAHGLNESDLGNRYLHQTISRFTTIDRFAELYPWLSPYVFAGNNPVTYIDINGDSIYVDEQERDDMSEILTEMFNQNAENFDYTDSGNLVYNGEIEDLPEEQQEMLSELLDYIRNPDINITGIIFQNRTEEGDAYTISEMRTIGRSNVTGYILEPAGPSTAESNQNKRIPEGVFELDNHEGIVHKNTYVLYNKKVPKSRTILYHSGNTASDTKGCQLPGNTKGRGRVEGSRSKLKELKEFISSHGVKSTITIINRRIQK